MVSDKGVHQAFTDIINEKDKSLDKMKIHFFNLSVMMKLHLKKIDQEIEEILNINDKKEKL